MIELYQGDCLELLPKIGDKSIDMILCDLPYGTTHNKWDKRIPLEPLFKEYNRIIKDNGAIALFAQQPFETDLINTNRRYFRYEWVWEKTMMLGFLNANKMPLRAHENIVVFYKHLPVYNPQKTEGKPYSKKSFANTKIYGKKKDMGVRNYGNSRFPKDVICFSNQHGALWGNEEKSIKHSAHKPISLLEYLIKTYTNEGETVLDNCMGSGSTGVACVNLGRNFIGMELDGEYFEAAKKRIEEVREPKP